MPDITPGQGSLISAGVSAVTNGFNLANQMQSNLANIRWANQSYNKQRRDALADRDFENAYNSPAAMMARLKAAGLSPNLVFDSGGAKTVSAQTRSSDMPQANWKAPEINGSGFTDSLNSYFENQYKTAQTDNTAALTDVARQELVNKTLESSKIVAETAKTAMDTLRSKADKDIAEQALKQAIQLAPITIEQAKANLQKTSADTQFTLDQNDRAAAMQGYNIKESIERVLKSRSERGLIPWQKNEIYARIRVLEKDAELKQLDANLKRIGVQPHDPAYQRAIQMGINKLMGMDWKKYREDVRFSHRSRPGQVEPGGQVMHDYDFE